MRKAIKISIFTLITISLILYNILNSIKYISASNHSPIATISFFAYDYLNEKPISNATICIVEFSLYGITNKNGYTDTYEIAISKNQQYGRTSSDFVLMTVIAYKNGYSDTIKYNIKLFPSKKKLGTVINMREITSDEDNSPYIIYEEQTEDFSKKIIKNHKK